MAMKVLEVDILSATYDNIRLFGQKNPVLEFFSLSGDKKEFIYKTNKGEKSGNYHSWKDSVKVKVHYPLQKDFSLLCELKDSWMCSSKKIGEVKVAFMDIVHGEKVSYHVVIPFGEEKGVLTLSYRFREDTMDVVMRFSRRMMTLDVGF